MGHSLSSSLNEHDVKVDEQPTLRSLFKKHGHCCVWCSLEQFPSRFLMHVRAPPPSETPTCTSAVCPRPCRRRNWSSSSLSTDASLPHGFWWIRWQVRKRRRLNVLLFLSIYLCFNIDTHTNTPLPTLVLLIKMSASAETCFRGGDVRRLKTVFHQRCS